MGILAEFGEGLGGKECKWVVARSDGAFVMMMHAGSFIHVSLSLSLSPKNPVGTPAPTKKLCNTLSLSLSLSLSKNEKLKSTNPFGDLDLVNFFSNFFIFHLLSDNSNSITPASPRRPSKF